MIDIDTTTQELLDIVYSSQYNSASVVPGPYGNRMLTYADYIASGQSLRIIEEYIQDNVLPYYANTHTESSYTGLHTSHLREEARSIIKSCTNAGDDDVIIFCGAGSTAAVDKMHRLLEYRNKESGVKTIVFHGPFEHHSNVLPWREGNFQEIPIAITKDGLFDLDDLRSKLIQYKGKGLLIGSFSAASNVTGIISPIDEITSILHQHGALAFWDYAAAAPYMNINMNPGNNLHKDAIFISTHKFIGGPGTPGILISKRSLFSNTVPLVPGGGTVHFVTRSTQRYYEDVETREEAGTPAIIESIRAGLVFKLKNEIGEEEIETREEAAVQYAYKHLLSNPNVFILGNTQCKRLAFFAFHIRCNGRYLHHNFVVALLNDLFGIQARGGCSCAGPYGHDLLDLSDGKSDEFMGELATGNVGIKPGWVRFSLNYFIPQTEVKFIVRAVQWIAEHGHLLLKEYYFDDQTALWIHTSRYHAKVRSLKDFKISYTAGNHAVQQNREQEQNTYFALADSIVQQAKVNWQTTPCQLYHYNQVENPLRWYTLAQDIQL